MNPPFRVATARSRFRAGWSSASGRRLTKGIGRAYNAFTVSAIHGSGRAVSRRRAALATVPTGTAASRGGGEEHETYPAKTLLVCRDGCSHAHRGAGRGPDGA